MRDQYTDLKNGFRPEGKYTPNMHSKLRSLKFEHRKPQKNMIAINKLMRGGRAFKELNGHCDFDKEGCMFPEGYQDLSQLLHEVRIKDMKSKLAKRKVQQFEELGINLDTPLASTSLNNFTNNSTMREPDHHSSNRQHPISLVHHPASFTARASH
jgi:hypothetical protein